MTARIKGKNPICLLSVFLAVIFVQFFCANSVCFAVLDEGEKLLKENASLTKEIYLLNEELESLSEENNRLLNQLDQCERDLTNVKRREALGSGRAEYKSLKNELEKAAADLSAAEEYIKELQEENKRVVIELKKSLAQDKSERALLRRSFEAEEGSSRHKLAEENEALKARLKDNEDSLMRDTERSKRSLESKEVHIKLLNNEIKNLKKDISRFAQVLKKAETKNIMLEKDLNSANVRLKEIGSENIDLKKKVSAMEDSLVNKIYENYDEAGAEKGRGGQSAVPVASPEQVLLEKENKALKTRVEFLESSLLNLGEDTESGPTSE